MVIPPLGGLGLPSAVPVDCPGTDSQTKPLVMTYTDLTEGVRLDITVEFISKRTVQTETGAVTRLLVADAEGRKFRILTAPNCGKFVGFKTGHQYRLSNLVGAVPEASTVDAFCPGCDAQLRAGTVLDVVSPALRTAVSELALSEPFAIADGETTVENRDTDAKEPVDDWQPMRSETVETPAAVCEHCEEQFQAFGHGDAFHPLSHGDAFHPSSHGDASPPIADNVRIDANERHATGSETVGVAAGGATDLHNFRENIRSGYTPHPAAISDEGLFYDYTFQTGERTEGEALFAPRYATAVTNHPLTDETERYLSVGLDSTLASTEFKRPQLELVVVVDVSGSMTSPFRTYHYDERDDYQSAESATHHSVNDGTPHETNEIEREERPVTKLDAAVESLCALTEQLRDDDELGVVLYNHRAHVAKPLRDVATTDMPAIRDHIREIGAGGGTNLADGFRAAAELFSKERPDGQTERRVLFMTDMMPNTGTTDADELTSLFAEAAIEGIHTTFIGIGLDANPALTQTLSGIRGANHYFIQSVSEFVRRLSEEFAYMVTPLVYDLTLELETDGYEIAAVHGSPSAEPTTNRLMHVGTLFPAQKDDGETRGGVVLVRLNQVAQAGEIQLVASWTERGGGEYTERVSVEMPDEPDCYDHSGVRKAVALARYARELRTWARDSHDRAGRETGVDELLPNPHGQHERQSVPLSVSPEFASRFLDLRSYLTAEIEAVGDETMGREVELVDTLCQRAWERCRA